MADKVWHKVEISTDEQTIEVYPTEMYDGIIIETSELDGTGSPRMYLNEPEMEFLILFMLPPISAIDFNHNETPKDERNDDLC